ncbi:peptidoglycan-binding protein [Shinella kummerowiae]|uniref:peptidoglycan-binding protein n=1 Tax=Shinella kummerowiae TaxID=417745 RepID=UPI0021B66037|nr:peptidoglycan-binding protein [Shinella kummerowiae]MCT7662243.1 peptidoglycan-binding protein [Shinella kummerowiae]
MSSLASRIDADVLRKLAPKVSGKQAASQTAVITGFGAMLPKMLPYVGVITPLRIQHFLAQTAHESDGFSTSEEYASGAAYEGRKDLGNTEAGDGKRFKGRGPIQLTGRSNYRQFTAWMRSMQPDCPDFERKPELVAQWPWAGWAAAFFWNTRNINKLADDDNLVAITKVINGGRNGLEDRARYLSKAKAVVMPLAALDVPADDEFPVLRRGSQGEWVDRLQIALAATGFYLLAIDGDFGGGTEGAVKLFQRSRGLLVDGIAGPKTFSALSAYLPETED